MAMMIHETGLQKRLQRQRAALGADRYDEMWEGVYMMAPMPNHEHQRLVARLTRVLDEIVTDNQLGEVVPGVNISDRVEGWEENFRVPDAAVFLKDTMAVNHDTFWFGGPDLAVEILSPGDQARKKLAFYSKVGTRELLILDRDPWQLELWRHQDDALRHIRSVSPGDGSNLASQVIPLELSLALTGGQPQVQVHHPETGKRWTL